MSEADVQASAATIESPTINGGGENGLSKKPLEGADTLDAPIASGGTGEKGANGTLDAALIDGKEALSEVVTAAVKEVNGVNGDLGNVAVNGLLVDAKDDEVKDGEAAKDLSSSKNEDPISVSEPSHAEADSSEDAANDVVKAEENSVGALATDATEVVLSRTDEPVAGAVPEAEQTTDATSSPTDTPTQVTNDESIVEATQAPTVEASVVDVPEEKVIALTVEETAPVNEEPTPSVAVDATEPLPPTQTPASAEVVDAPVAVEEPTPKIASPQVVAADIPVEETLPALSAATAEPEREVVPEAVIAPIEDVPITVDVQTAPEAPIPEATEVPPIADSAPEATTVAASKPIDIEAPVKEEPIKEVALPVVNESSPESTEEVLAKPDVVEVAEETESAQVTTPEAPPAEAIVEGLAPAVEESKVAAEAPLVEATPAEESSTVVAVEEPVKPTEEPAEKVDSAEEVPVIEELKPADVFEPAAPAVAEVAQTPPDLVDEEVKPALEETEPVVEAVESIEEAKPVVEEKAVVEEVTPAAVDDVKDEEATPVSEEKLVEEPVEATPIVEDEKPVVHEVAPEVVTEAPIVEEIPVVEETEPVVADEELIIKEESPVREAEVVEEATPLVQEEAAVVEEKPATEEAKPPVQEELEAVVEEKPIVQEEPAVQDIATAAEEETPVAQSVVAPEPVVENPEPAQEEPKAVDDVTLVEEAAKPAEDPKVEEANEDVKPLDAAAVPDDDVSPPVLKEEEEPKSTVEEANPVEATIVDVTKTVEEEAKPAVGDAPAEPTPLVENPTVTEEPAASKAVDEGPEPAKEDPAPIVVEAVAEAEPTSSPPVETISEEVDAAIHVAESLPISEPEPAESAPANSVAVVAADEDLTDVKPTVEEAKVVTEVEDIPPTETAQPVQEDDKVDEEVKVLEPEVLLSTPTPIVAEETTQDTSSDKQASFVEETKSESKGAEEKVADEVDLPTHAHAEVVTAASEKSESIEAPSEVAPTEPAQVSEESTDSPSVILNVDSAASDPEVEEAVVVPIEEEMVFAPREEEVKSPKERRSTSIDVVGEASAEEITADVVSPPTDPSEPPIVIVDESAISAEEIPSASEVTNDPIERPKSPWTPSYSVIQVGSGVEAVDQIGEEVAPAGDLATTAVPEAETSESERPSTTWTPSYSTTSQGSRSPSPLPAVEDPATEPLSEATAVEDVPIVTETTNEQSAAAAEPPSIMITSQSQSEEVEAAPALEIETKVEQDMPERPKSPWTPSYSVTTQGSPLVESAELPHPPIESDVTPVVTDDISLPVPPPVGEVVDLLVPEVAVSIAEPQPIDTDIPEPISSREEIVEPVLDVEPLSVPSSSTDEPEEVQRALSPSLHVTLADVPEPSTVPEQPAAPEILSTSLSRSKSADSLTPDDNLERPKSPWTPSYSVTSQGSPNLSPQVLTEEPPSIEVETGADVESVPTVETPAQPSVDPSPVEAIIAPVPERPKSPWTPSYSVTQQGSTPPSPQPAPAPAPTELVVNADIDAQSDIAAASLATEGPSSPRSALADLDSDTFSDVSDQRIPDSEETQPTVVESDVDNPQEVEASSQTPVLSSAQLAVETVTTPTEEAPEPSVTITVDEPVVESNPQTPRNEPSEEPQAFPSNTKPSVSRLDTSGEPHELDTSLSTLETPAQSRKRLESTASSRFFPGGWFSTSPTIGGRTSLENAQGEFSALKSPIDMAGTTAPATTPVDGLAEDEERKSRWCTIM